MLTNERVILAFYHPFVDPGPAFTLILTLHKFIEIITIDDDL
jgi:hypothetical protein